jgi:hypothetical protein
LECLYRTIVLCSHSAGEMPFAACFASLRSAYCDLAEATWGGDSIVWTQLHFPVVVRPSSGRALIPCPLLNLRTPYFETCSAHCELAYLSIVSPLILLVSSHYYYYHNLSPHSLSECFVSFIHSRSIYFILLSSFTNTRHVQLIHQTSQCVFKTPSSSLACSPLPPPRLASRWPPSQQQHPLPSPLQL